MSPVKDVKPKNHDLLSISPMIEQTTGMCARERTQPARRALSPAMQAKYHKGHGRDQGVTVTLPASALF